MARTLDPETRRRLQTHLQYYRDLGIYDFYRREGAMLVTEVVEESDSVDNFKTEGALKLTTQKKQTPGDPIAALKNLRSDIGDCTMCRLAKGRTNLVFGSGSPNANIMFIGEAPGADEDM